MTRSEYRYGGARALVALHADHLRGFLAVWRRADLQDLALPPTSDPSYASREVLLAHVLGGAARYLTWICEQLGLPRPDVVEYPAPAGFGSRAEAYLDEVLAAWEGPLQDVTEEFADTRVFTSRWGAPYTIDAMLEHAVMHPIRHAHQLERLLAEQR